jgi:hypothetical protein
MVKISSSSNSFKWPLAVLFVAVLALSGCLKTTPTSPNSKVQLNYVFESGTEGWQAGFSDYPANLSSSDSLDLYGLSYGFSVLPVTVIPIQSGIRIKGFNRSDDLFMYLKKKITGLLPNTNYKISYLIEIASNVPTNATGAGGAPGEAVTVKAGAKNIEPVNTVDASNYYRLNIDKGNQSVGGKDMIPIGNVGVTDTTTRYTLIRRANSTPLVKSTNSFGELWLIVGTDSGFEGLTDIYYGSIKVLLEQ